MTEYIQKDGYTVIKFTNKFKDVYEVKISNSDVEICKRYKISIHKILVKLSKQNIHKIYASAINENKTILLHRLLTNAPKGMEVDHINGDCLDNRRENLRICTHQENLSNRKKRLDNKSGYPGVFWYTHCKTPAWVAYIKVNYKRIHLGQFRVLEDAIKARRDAELKYFGEFSRALEHQ
ncbi:MAG: HNH endonuclease [Anaerorhabdus sp.]